MAVRILDGSVLTVGDEFRALVDAHPPTGFHSLLLGVVMTAAAFSVLALHIPTAVGIWNDMMFFSCHMLIPCVPWGSIQHSRLHPNSRP